MPNVNLIKRAWTYHRMCGIGLALARPVRKNFRAVVNCGTSALGWQVYASDTEEVSTCTPP